MSRLRWLSVGALVLGPLLGPTRLARSQEGPPAFPTTSELVVLDLVARDKAGRMVTDLRPDEVEVREDGQPCPVQSFRLVHAGITAAASPAASAERGARPTPGVPASPLREALLLLVFDRLSPEAAAVARSAATDFVKRPFPPGTWVAVLEIGSTLRLAGGLTQDLGRAEAAIAMATTGSGPGEAARGADQASPTRDAMTAALVATRSAVGVDALDPVAAAQIRAPAGMAEPKQREVEARILTEIDSLNRQRLGQDSLHALHALATALATVEGRKTVLYFSEGLNVPSVVADVLDRVVSQANRANVAVYAFDPRGLVSDSAFDESKRALLAAQHLSERAMRSTGAEEGPTRGVSPMEVKTHDLALDALRLNAQANLRDLAEATGGFLVADTNDLGAALERVGADLRRYYEIGYAPANPLADGAFRSIEVKVRRRGVTVRTRRGYFALPAGQSASLPYQLALAEALGRAELPRDFTHDVATSLGEGSDGARGIEVVVRVPVRDLRLETDDARGTYRAHFSVLVVVRDPSGAVVTKLSHDWPLSGPLSGAAAARQQSAAVRRTLDLEPGRYTLETAVLDRLSGARSASRTALDVAP